MTIYVGSRTTKARKAEGEGITVYEEKGGSWQKFQTLPCLENPSYLCGNRAGSRLYAIHGDGCTATALARAKDGTLTELNTVPVYGTNPVHLALSPKETSLYVASLETGSVAQVAVEADGSLGAVRQLTFVPGQPGHGYVSHPHQVCLDPSGRWLLVPAQGRDHGVGGVTVYAIHPETEELEACFFWQARLGAEPRHMAFHPNGKFVYLVNEKDSTVLFFHFDPETGSLEPQQLLTSLPEDYFGPGWASGIVMGKGGKTLYVSNRTHDSVTVYALEPETGRMTYVQNVLTGGRQPRFIGLNPEGTELVAANELTHTLSRFAVQKAGTLVKKTEEIPAGSPVCVWWQA